MARPVTGSEFNIDGGLLVGSAATPLVVEDTSKATEQESLPRSGGNFL